MHLRKKKYFLPLGTTSKTGVSFIGKKITDTYLLLNHNEEDKNTKTDRNYKESTGDLH